jgi:hypothetical protein
MYLIAGIILLVEIKDHDGYQFYKAYLAAAVSMEHEHIFVKQHIVKQHI